MIFCNHVFNIGDTVQVVDGDDDDFGMVGTVTDTYTNIVEVKLTDFTKGDYEMPFHPGQLELIQNQTVWGNANPVFTLPPGVDIKWTDFTMPNFDSHVVRCKHEWKSDSYFSAKVYTTCTKCGAKKEEQ